MRNDFKLSRLLLSGLVLAVLSVSGKAVDPRVAGEVMVSGDATAAADSRGPVPIQVTKPSGRATVTFSYQDTPLDLSAFRDIAILIKNATAAELDVLIAATSNPEEAWRFGTSGRFLVRADEELDMTALLARQALPSDHPHVKRLGHLFAFPWGHSSHWAAADPAALRRATVRISWRNAKAGQTIEVGPPRGAGAYSTDPALLDTFELPMVDEFGQARWLDWSGKVRGAEELREDGRRDVAFASKVTDFGDKRGRFGGLIGGPKLEATGFFRVEKVDGKWWFVDPEGDLFWSLGVNGASYGAESIVRGREHLFHESMRGQPKAEIYEDNLKRKYGGDDWLRQHIDVTVARMLAWGVNTAGAWSRRELLQAQRVPYTLIIHTSMARLGSLDKIPDPFSKSFADSLEGSMASLAADHAESPWLLGIFVDNELNWTGDTKLVQEIIKSPNQTAARVALVEFLRERHGDVAALNKAWGTSFADLTAITPKPGPGGERAYQQDLDDFLALFSDKYFGLCRAAMDRYFPHHLYLGNRFNVRNTTVRKVAARYCDVLSINIYQHDLEGFSMGADVDRPWLISEFHFGTRDNGNLGTGLAWAADARNRADVVEAFLSDALRHPNFVGAHWFQWGDQGVTGRSDGENFGVGLVTVVDRPVRTLTDAIRAVSRELFHFRLGASQGRIGEGEEPPSGSPDATETTQTP